MTCSGVARSQEESRDPPPHGVRLGSRSGCRSGGARCCTSARNHWSKTVLPPDPRSPAPETWNSATELRRGRCHRGPEAASRRFDAQPVEHRQFRDGLEHRTVVAVRDGFVRQGSYPFSHRRAAHQMGSAFGGVGFIHLQADDLAAVEIQNQILGKLVGLMAVCPVLLPSEQCSAGQHCADLAPLRPDSF